MKIVQPTEGSDEAKIIKAVALVFCDTAQELVVNLHQELGATKPQACSLALSGSAGLMLQCYHNLALVCGVRLSEDKKDQLAKEIEDLLNKWVLEVYDVEDGKHN